MTRVAASRRLHGTSRAAFASELAADLAVLATRVAAFGVRASATADDAAWVDRVLDALMLTMEANQPTRRRRPRPCALRVEVVTRHREPGA